MIDIEVSDDIMQGVFHQMYNNCQRQKEKKNQRQKMKRATGGTVQVSKDA